MGYYFVLIVHLIGMMQVLFINTHVHGISGTLEIRQSLTTKFGDKEEDKCDLVTCNVQEMSTVFPILIKISM